MRSHNQNFKEVIFHLFLAKIYKLSLHLCKPIEGKEANYTGKVEATHTEKCNMLR